ncbi:MULTISPECIES: SOS response-associated peptidase [Haloferacaceae]|uniref:SOS response-associated peptidase n=1 Tax=Halorubrum glutamatedens TaxID=2707018 RepID=A0ABD5QWD7_9EURY|nr:SOS response-associated peptidase [Halobellus captivus]
MCGRYTLFTPVGELESRFDATFGDGLEPSYNCAPGEDLPVVTVEDPDRATRMTWGLTPSWAEEPFDLINARAETVRDKRSFADAYESRRCLVPADGFYEWVDDGTGKRPYRVAFEDDRPFAMAGLYERWKPPKPETTQTGLGAFGGGTGANGDADPGDEGRVRETFTVVTTEPNDLVADLHHRMAVILAPDEEERWLHGDPDEAAAIMDPHPATEMKAYPVSTRVNATGTDGSELIEPVDAG